MIIGFVSRITRSLRKSKTREGLSADLPDYMCGAANLHERSQVQTAFGIKDIRSAVLDVIGISLDPLNLKI